MRHLQLTIFAGTTLLLFVGCDNITNPVNEMGEKTNPYVRFQDETAIGVPGTVVEVILQLPVTLEEDVDVSFTLDGNAVFGEDFTVVDTDGTVRDDVTADGGTASIQYDPDETGFDRDTIFVSVNFDAVDGRSLEIYLAEAQAESDRDVDVGRGDQYDRFDISIKGFADDIAYGTYAGQRTGFSSADASVTVTKPDDPVEVAGDEYSFVISDISGAGDLFGVAIPWSFNVTTGGTVVGAPASHVFDVQSGVSGTFDFDDNILIMNVVYSPDIQWTLQLVLE